MAIGRISGQVLKSNLYREDVDISFSNFPGDTPLLYFNVADNKLGVNTDTPTTELEISGTTTTTNLVSTLSNLGDVEIQNNLVKSTSGNLQFEPATVADKLNLNSNTTVTQDLTVDKTVFTKILDVAGGISLFAQGGLNPGSYSMASFDGISRTPSIAEDGDVLLTTDTSNFVIQPAPGTVFGVEGDMRIDGSLTLEENTNLTFINAAGDTVISINGETGVMEPEELIVDDIYIHDNVIETLPEGTDLVLRGGPVDSSNAENSGVRIESDVFAVKTFNILGPEGKLVIDNELEIDGNTIESYASDLNFIVNNLGDSTVNTFNFFGNTNNYGFVYVEDDLTVNQSLVTDTITSFTTDLTISMGGKGKVIVDDELDVTRKITTQTISTLEARDLLIAPESKKTVFDDTIEVPDLISTRSIQGVIANIDNVQIDENTITSVTGNLNIETPNPGTTFINFNSDLEVQGNIHATGTISADGDLILGDEDTDNITFNADINSNVLPDINSDGTTGYTLGAINKNWKNIFSKKLTLDGYTTDKIDNDELNIQFNPSDTAVVTQGALARFVGNVTTGDRIPIGPPEDSTFDDGAFLKSAETDENGFAKLDIFDFDMKVSQAVDLLNESMNNIRNNTFIRTVNFEASPTAAGSGSTVTLTLDVDGTHNQVEVDWDVTGQLAAQGAADPDKDQVYPSGTTTVSYTYNAPLGGLFTVRVVVRNTDAQFPGSAGTDAEEEKIDYIIIYTPDPVADFDLYRNLTGGSALAGNFLFVTEGNLLFLENLTTNTGATLGAGNTATYSIDWGDGSTPDSIASDTDAGGRDGARISHTFADGTTTGTGTATVELTLDTHSTADPAVIPTSVTTNIKIYENDPADPNYLDTKTLTFGSTTVNGATGESPKLASGFTDNTGGIATLTPGSSVNRTTKTSGTIESAILSSLTYSGTGIASDFLTGPAPVLESYVNGTLDGSLTFDNIVGLNSNTGTNNSVVITQDSDYNLFDAAGDPVSFLESIYFPGAFGGFKAKVAEDATSLGIGVNCFQLRHTTPNNPTSSNILEFVKDDLTVAPTLGGGTIFESIPGTYRYISGIPYYNVGSPKLVISGITVENFIGQTYADISNVLEVKSGTNLELTSSSAIQDKNFSYAAINNGSSPFLSGGVPIANTGVGSPYTLAPLEINITTALVRTVDTVRYRINNVNSPSAFVNKSTAIAVHRSAQFGISEIAIAVDNSLGNGVYTDDAIRIYNLATNSVDNPAFNSTGVNYYTNNPYQESADPGVEGTQEATIRLGVLEHNIIDYTDQLPSGPDRSGDTGRQYFTMAFRRQVVANFGINITSSTGVAGVWIAAPGTAIDSASSINGWLDTSIQYAGAGVPGGDSGNGGNGSNGCAVTGSDIIATNTPLSGQYNMTLGAENMSNATDNVVLVRIALDAGQKVTTLEIKEV